MRKHLRVLRTGTIIEEVAPTGDARVRVYRLRPERLSALSRWLDDVEAFWTA